MHRRHLLLGSLAALLLPAAPASAGAVRPLDPDAFRSAQDAGQGIVVFVHAPW
jgi:hypothetical protein